MLKRELIVTGVGPANSFRYLLKIYRQDGTSEIRGTAKIGEEIDVRDPEEVDAQETC